MFKKVIASVLVVCMIATPALADMSDYMKNFLGQLGNLEPKAYHMQQRGYFVGGTMHVPPAGITIQPFSITLPNIKNNSCGGIDVTMGGFSYLNFDYLVQKLQGIIQAAPALAFQIAIKVLSEQLGDSADWLETVTNAINGLNFNSCTAMNGIVTTTANAINKAIKETGGEGTKRQNEGGGDFFGSIISDIGNNIWDAAKNYVEDIYNKFKDATGKDSDARKETGTMKNAGLLEETAEEMGGLPSDFINMMRYYLGDVFPGKKQGSSDKDPAYYSFIKPPCGAYSNPKDFVNDIAHGVFRMVTASDLKDGKCKSNEYDAGDNGLKKQVKTAMEKIYEALENNSDLDQKTINLIEISPIPIYAFLRNSVLVGHGYSQSLIEELAEPVSLAIAAEYVTQYIGVVRSALGSTMGKMKVNGGKEVLTPAQQYMNYLLEFSNKVYDAELNAMNRAQKIYGDFMKRYNLLVTDINKITKQYHLKSALDFQKRRAF